MRSIYQIPSWFLFVRNDCMWGWTKSQSPRGREQKLKVEESVLYTAIYRSLWKISEGNWKPGGP